MKLEIWENHFNWIGCGWKSADKSRCDMGIDENLIGKIDDIISHQMQLKNIKMALSNKFSRCLKSWKEKFVCIAGKCVENGEIVRARVKTCEWERKWVAVERIVLLLLHQECTLFVWKILNVKLFHSRWTARFVFFHSSAWNKRIIEIILKIIRLQC